MADAKLLVNESKALHQSYAAMLKNFHQHGLLNVSDLRNLVRKGKKNLERTAEAGLITAEQHKKFLGDLDAAFTKIQDIDRSGNHLTDADVKFLQEKLGSMASGIDEVETKLKAPAAKAEKKTK